MMNDTSECLEKKHGDSPGLYKDQGHELKSVRSEEGKNFEVSGEEVMLDQHNIEAQKPVDATSHSTEAIEKRPVANKQGCPFKHHKSFAEVSLSYLPPHAANDSKFSNQKLTEVFKKMPGTSESLEEKVADRLAFDKEQHSPFKSVRSEEQVESVASDVGNFGPPGASTKKIMATDITNIKEACPAFQPLCPFSKLNEKAGAFAHVKKCPAFKDGCPFKGCKNIREICVKLQEIPNLDQENSNHGEVLSGLKMVHDLCIDLENELGECPIFKTEMGCPFKTVFSNGKLILEKLVSYLANRALSEATESAKETIEQELIPSSGIILSNELKGGTKKIHRMAENTFFVKQLLKGHVTPAAYKLLLSNLFFVYRTIEEEGEKNKSHPKLSTTYFPQELNRTSEIIKDMEFFYGNDWKDEIEPVNTTKRYVARLQKLSAEDPLMLLAHQYTRYMGDLSGGQVIKRILMKALNLSDDGGLKFYEFDQVQNKKAFKNKYRNSLDALQLDKDTAGRLVEESIKAFELNIELFNELGAICGYISENVDTVSEMQSQPSNEETMKKPPMGKCPFAIGQLTANQPKSAAAAAGIPKTDAELLGVDVHHGRSSSANLVLVLGVLAALLAIVCACLLA